MKRMLLPVVVMTTVAGAGLAQGMMAPTTSAAQPSATPSPAAARFETRVPAIAFVPIRRVPPNMSRSALSGDCDHLLTAPTSDAGRLVQKLGWGVTADLTIGSRTIVSFVGSAIPATSGTCELGRGNIAIFDGGQVVALAYARASQGRTIGRVAPMPGRGARIWDGDLVPRPVADLVITPGGTPIIDRVAREDQVCDGAAKVPNIYDQPIYRARISLAKAGWKPVAAANGDGDERVAILAAAGLAEAQSCAGTGFGFCSFGYRGTAGALTVITMGDGPMPVVSGYRVECHRR